MDEGLKWRWRIAVSKSRAILQKFILNLITARVFLLILLVTLSIIFVVGSVASEPSEDDSFTFVVVSDSHTGGGPNTGEAVFRRIIEQINERKPDFVVHCGDWIIGPTYEERGNATADTFFHYISLLDSSIAFYPVLGNHEGDFKDYSYSLSCFPVLGEGWYSFDHGNSHFFVVENNSDSPDSSLHGYRHCKPNGGINTSGSKQRIWLERDLASRSGETAWTFGFGHRSYYGAEQYSGRKNIEIARTGEDAFCRFIENEGVDVFFNGDQHCYTRVTPIRSGVPWVESDSSTVYITCGGAGGRIDRGKNNKLPFPASGSLPDGAFVTGTKSSHFFLHATIDGAVFHANVIDTSGALIDSFTISK